MRGVWLKLADIIYDKIVFEPVMRKLRRNILEILDSGGRITWSRECGNQFVIVYLLNNEVYVRRCRVLGFTLLCRTEKAGEDHVGRGRYC